MEKKLNLSSSAQRYNLAKVCPCGKSNKDGKFSPDKNNPDCGYCHACDKAFFPETEREVIQQYTAPTPPSVLDRELIQGAFSRYDKNNFIKALKRIFPSKNIEEKAKAYGVGTSKHWEGATIFFQDTGTEIRGGKVMLYDEVTAKRVKEPFNHFNWLHKILKIEAFNLVQCLFGLHLTKDNNKPIGVVESEKTAFIMSLVDDRFIWVATGGKGNFKYEMLEPLKDKKVFAYPDSGEFELWNSIALRLAEHGLNIKVSKEIEAFPKGTDLADIALDEVKNKPQPTTAKGYDLEALKGLAGCIIPEQDQRTEKEFLKALNQLEGVDQAQAKELINKMILNDVISRTSQKTYYLFHSTPF
jgi:hypothetical protein